MIEVPKGEEPCPPPVLYPERWVQLAFLSLLALLSDWVCFSVAAVPEPWTKVFGEGPENLIDLFLFTNVFFCFIEPYAIKAFGLRTPIVGAGLLMAAGCVLRSGVPFVGEVLPEYVTMVAGTMMVAAAQPFFQCTPPLLSATWFAPNERAQATAIAINFNQVGIATAFLIGGEMGRTVEGLKPYFDVMTISAVVVALGAMLFFQERPPTPPSTSELEKMDMQAEGKDDVGFIEQVQIFLSTPGFIQPLIAFVCSIAVTNVVGAFLERLLNTAGISSPETVEYVGVGFELAIVIGGIVLGGLVDENKEYKKVTLACLAATLVAVFVSGLSVSPAFLVVVALLAIGALTGPVQPINAELAVEVTYPADENAIEATQQLCGNLVSALLVPVCLYAAGYTLAIPGTGGGIQGDTALLMVLVAGCLGYYSTFNAPLKRTEVDNAACLVVTDDEDLPLKESTVKGELTGIADMAKERVDSGSKRS